MSARFRDLAAEIRAAITDGTFPPGSKLPSESELAERYAVSRGTVRQTFALLRADGLIASQQGARRI
ncbi:winged helix-turn-helix domain-containing protein, partial [Longispora fulva]